MQNIANIKQVMCEDNNQYERLNDVMIHWASETVTE